MAEQNGARRRTALLVAGGLLAGGAAAGVIGVTAATASGAPSLTSAVSSGSPLPGYGQSGEGGFPSGSHGPGETLATGSTAAKLTAAALKAVPGGTVLRVETDSGDAAYEAHMKKPDGTLVTVKLDSSLTVTGVEDGMGKGGPGGAGPQGGGSGTAGQAPSGSPASGSAT
ncbi:hypothetical protein QDR37_16085 [Amnibacterium sp. CER49]|uniref:hypothetical protein n=1 Tax=Amnibacterium sp. CER49 TaxID=3039161 RepID=UPI002446D099|nr:hypothetical protein [Amnibacterium sp. CER49]MDH2445467.1 hypothetical protein [Amnibacterium sp. CER49]